MPPKRKIAPVDVIDKKDAAKRRKAETAKIRRQSMTEEQRERERHRRRISNMTVKQRKRERGFAAMPRKIEMSPLDVTAKKDAAKRRKAERAKIRRKTMTEEQRERERDRRRILNMTVKQRERERERDRRRFSNMTVEQRYQKKQCLKNDGPTICAAFDDVHFDETIIATHNCGRMNIICEFCLSKNFSSEQPADKLFSHCCHKGLIKLPAIRTSAIIERLMTRQHEHSSNFFENIRSINSSLAFASMGANIVPPPGYGPYCFRINGQIYHRTGALHPVNDDPRKFAQLYILDPDMAANHRMNISSNADCNPDLMRQLSTFLHNCNPFVESCKMLNEVEIVLNLFHCPQNLH